MGYGLGVDVPPEDRIAPYSATRFWRQLGLLETNGERVAPANDGLQVLIVGPKAPTVPL